MTTCQQTFKRNEKKYLLTSGTCRRLMGRLADRVQLDEYGRHTICNIYYDSSDDRIIRTSIEGPAYKEKLRLRSYGVPGAADTVFIELKKKCGGVVYKRREAAPLRRAEAFLRGERQALPQTQILREVSWVLGRYSLEPRVFIACDREAYFSAEDPDLRITFDRDIRFRESELTLSSGDWGTGLLDGGQVLMEIKAQGALPLWLCACLSEERVFPMSFSKYGEIYKAYLCRGRRGEFTCA